MARVGTPAIRPVAKSAKESGGRTRTHIREVTGEERTEEVARMLSGAKLTETSRKHAEQMIRANG